MGHDKGQNVELLKTHKKSKGDVTHTHKHIQYLPAETDYINWDLSNLNCIRTTSQAEGSWGEKRKRDWYRLNVCEQNKIKKINISSQIGGEKITSTGRKKRVG